MMGRTQHKKERGQLMIMVIVVRRSLDEYVNNLCADAFATDHIRKYASCCQPPRGGHVRAQSPPIES